MPKKRCCARHSRCTRPPALRGQCGCIPPGARSGRRRARCTDSSVRVAVCAPSIGGGGRARGAGGRWTGRRGTPPSLILKRRRYITDERDSPIPPPVTGPCRRCPGQCCEKTAALPGRALLGSPPPRAERGGPQYAQLHCCQQARAQYAQLTSDRELETDFYSPVYTRGCTPPC